MKTIYSHEQALAELLVVAFNAPECEPRFLQLCRKYPQSVIHRALRRAQQTPAEHIKKTRVALFIFLAKFYGHRPYYHPGA